MISGVEIIQDGIHDSGGTVHDIEWWCELLFHSLLLSNVGQIFIGDPSGVYGIHMNTRVDVIGCHLFRVGATCLGATNSGDTSICIVLAALWSSLRSIVTCSQSSQIPCKRVCGVHNG